jgi:hypothetical protein
MKISQLTRKQLTSVRCPTCGVASGKRCILVAGVLRSKPHLNRRLMVADSLEAKKDKNPQEIFESVST